MEHEKGNLSPIAQNLLIGHVPELMLSMVYKGTTDFMSITKLD